MGHLAHGAPLSKHGGRWRCTCWKSPPEYPTATKTSDRHEDDIYLCVTEEMMKRKMKNHVLLIYGISFNVKATVIFRMRISEKDVLG